MGKCCSKSLEDHETKEDTCEVLLEIEPGGVGPNDDIDMTGGTLVVRTPGRWGVTPRGAQATKKPTIVPAKTTTGGLHTTTKKITINNGANNAAAVTKTFTFSSTGGAAESVSYGAQSGGYTKGTRVSGAGTRHTTTASIFTTGGTSRVTNGTSRVTSATSRVTSGTVTTGTSRVTTGTSRVTNGTSKATNGSNKTAFFGVRAAAVRKSMGKTSTETTTRTYTKNGKNFEETVEVVTKIDDAGNKFVNTKTTTKEVDAFDTKELRNAIDGAKTSTGRQRSSSSSSDTSPTRASASKSKPKSSKGGLLSMVKGNKVKDGSDDEEDFVKDVYNSVNEYRVKHGVAKLKLNKEMNKYAKEWAKKMAADEQMKQNPDSKYGDNVFCLSSNSKTFKVKGDEVVDKWYSESKDHTYGEEPKGSLLKSGHFSQMVWKDTKQMGVGKARSDDGTKVFVVANFDPQGNWMGQFATQVPPVGGFPKSASGKTSIFNRAKKSSSSDSDSSSDEEDFAEEVLKSHNDYRKKHGAPPLKLNKKLSKYAKEWANTIAKKDKLQHRDNNEHGENLYCAWSSNPKHMIKGSEAVESWYSEIKDFSFGREPSDLRAGHFTQVVWSDSKELGVAFARSASNKLYVVANYSPAGNFVGSFGTKVPRPK